MIPANDSGLDARLDAGLGSLPREVASDGFTERVLKEVESRSTSAEWRLLAAALALLTIGVASYAWTEQRQDLEAVERIATLRAEYEVLQEELAVLAEAKRQRGIVHLAGNDEVEFVVDLRRLARQQAGEWTGTEPGSDQMALAADQSY